MPAEGEMNRIRPYILVTYTAEILHKIYCNEKTNDHFVMVCNGFIC